MKKKLLVAIGVLMMIGCMTACGSSTEGTAQEEVKVVVESLDDVNSEAAGTSEAADTGVYTTDDYSFSYTPGTLEVNEARGSVIVNFCKADVQAPGSNEIIISKEEGATVDEIIQAIVGDDSMDMVTDGTLGTDMIPVKNYVTTSESQADSSLTLVDQVMVMASGDDVIILDIITTITGDDEIDMTVQGAFTYTLESFVLK